ncbi:hypothetical protein ACIP79_03080 [Streptomyces sp. NPDC088747]|uniref:hypothetical protein n=1 Tax=Streptomyces sp. NPDC088747 TaxID=3365886 RepID=UPI00382CC9BA
MCNTLQPQDLVREVLDDDLRYRGPGRYAELHRTLRGWPAGRLRALGDEREQLRLLTETIVVVRPRHPVPRETRPRPRLWSDGTWTGWTRTTGPRCWR